MMKKIAIVIVIITSIGFIGLSAKLFADSITVSTANPGIIVTSDRKGQAVFTGVDIQYLSQIGEPMLPYKIVKVLLPPDAVLSTVTVSMQTRSFSKLSGKWDVAPVPPPASWDGKREIVDWPPGRDIKNGRDMQVYEKNSLFPTELIQSTTTGKMRKWQILDIPVSLFQYNPVEMQLYRLDHAELVITFSRDSKVLTDPKLRALFSDRIGERRVKHIVVNFSEIAPEYEKLVTPKKVLKQTGGYAIITTNTIASSSSKLTEFVLTKQIRGFNVHVVTESTWGGGTGDTAAENIRTWLINNYIGLQIEYVLLIGNPHPDTGHVPMKMLWPRNHATTDTNYKDSPSDYYYADLTGNWDLDNDGYYAEWLDDFNLFGGNGVDRNYEVMVGRIPYYGDISDVDHILSKIMSYNDDMDTAWRRNVLLPMKPSDSVTPGYHLGEQIRDSVVVPKGWNSYRVYDETYGCTPPPEATPCTVDKVANAWNNLRFGAVLWWTHGSAISASHVIDLSHAVMLNDNYPGFTFQSSCSNSYPEYSFNLSWVLLKNGSIGTIGATRVSWYTVGQNSFPGSCSNAGMTYEYAARLISNEMESGYALHDLKQDIVPTHMDYWMNFTDFCLYGDPSIGLFPAEDSDMDNLPDWWEEHYFGSGNLTQDTHGDPDNDCWTNIQEYYCHYTPTNPLSPNRWVPCRGDKECL